MKKILFLFLLITNLVYGQAYIISQIGYSPKPLTGTLVPAVDDAVYGPFPIGFQFCYWGDPYTQFYIGSNGWVGFTVPQSASFTSQLIPSTNFLVPKNCIMGPWYDLNPGIAGSNPPSPIQYIYYQLYGVSPNRHLVVSWNNSPLYQCTGLRGTQQIILYENGIIENNIQQKRVCFTWANGTATQGLHNINGTQSVVVTGRNSTQWAVLSTQPESWRYTPNFPIVYPCCPQPPNNNLINEILHN